MIAYLRIIMLRWIRNPLGIEAVIGATGAPLAFSAAAYWIFWAYAPDPARPTGQQFQTTILSSAVFFSSLASAFAFTHVMTRTIHVEKQENRIRLLRSSGLDGLGAALAFLAASIILSAVLVPLSMAGAWILSAATELPPISPSLVIASVAAIIVLGPFVIASRMMLHQPFALTASYSAAFVGAYFHTSRMADHAFSVPPSYILGTVASWGVVTGLLVMGVLRDQRRRGRLWV